MAAGRIQVAAGSKQQTVGRRQTQWKTDNGQPIRQRAGDENEVRSTARQFGCSTVRGDRSGGQGVEGGPNEKPTTDNRSGSQDGGRAQFRISQCLKKRVAGDGESRELGVERERRAVGLRGKAGKGRAERCVRHVFAARG